MLQSEEDKQLLKAIIHLTETMNLEILAEGIEDQEQLDFLIAHRCTYGQGFYFAKPMPSSACSDFLKEYKHGVIAYTFD